MAVDIKVLVLGGCGFIGRHVVSELLQTDGVSKIVVVDKVPFQISWFNSCHKDVFSNEKVEFRSANLINKSSVDLVFSGTWNWVINAGCETKAGQTDAVYEEGIVKLSDYCVEMASKANVDVYVHVSSGKMASSEKKAHSEQDACQPWSVEGRMHHLAEERIRKESHLNWLIVRPGLTYGIGDKHGIINRMILGAIYSHLGEPMKLLWNENLHINTVHVSDLARAIIWLCKSGISKEIYNVVDEANSTQGSISQMISEIFDVSVEYMGNILSSVAKMDVVSLVGDINEKHLLPWGAMCRSAGIVNTPLTPYVDADVVQNGHLHLDGQKLRDAGFQYRFEKPTKELLIEVLRDYIGMNLFPDIALN